MPLSTEMASDVDTLERLATEWTRLWQGSPRAAIFQSPDWLIPWWRHLGEGSLRVLAVRDGPRLVGLAPLFRLGSPPDRRLLLVGCGTSDQLGLLALPAYEQPAARALVDYLEENRREWDQCQLHPLPGDSPLLEVPAAQGLRSERLLHDVCPYVRLPRDPGELARVIPPQHWKKLQYYRRSAARRAAPYVQTANETDVQERLTELMELHRLRWSRAGQGGVLADPRIQQFHREAAARLARSGHLRLYTLRLEDRPAAALYGLLYAGRFSYYIGGFHPEWRQLSPGMLLVGYAMERAIQEGAEVFDFLRGREAYKYAWGALDRPCYSRRFWPAVSRGAAGERPCGSSRAVNRDDKRRR